MSLIVANDGALESMTAIRTRFNSLGVVMHLGKNDITPSQADVLGDYVEADFDGYASVVSSTFTVPTIVAGRALIADIQIVWTMTGAVTPNDIYTVYWELNGVLLGAERLAGAPIAMTAPGDQIAYTPSFTGVSEFV